MTDDKSNDGAAIYEPLILSNALPSAIQVSRRQLTRMIYLLKFYFDSVGKGP